MAADRIEILESGEQNASGNSGAVNLKTATMAMLTVNVSSVSGTSPQLDVWLQGSDDGGTTWYDLVADQALQTKSDDAAGGTVRTNVRDVVDAKTSTDAERFMAIYKHLPTDKVRLRWKISGTSPAFTFGARLVVK